MPTCYVHNKSLTRLFSDKQIKKVKTFLQFLKQYVFFVSAHNLVNDYLIH